MNPRMLFKNQYYYFISGLPEIAFDNTKLPFTVETFREMLHDVLEPEDKKLVDRYFTAYDNHTLLQMLNQDASNENASKKSSDNRFSDRPKGTLSREEIETAIRQVQEGDALDKGSIPPYFEEAIAAWLNEALPGQARTLEDLISSLYMDYGREVKNSLIAGWFEMNLNLGNLLSAIYARKYEMEVEQVVVGNNEIAKTIRENANARDFGMGDELDYYDAILRFTEEENIHERERKIDQFRWNWLEENTLFDYFNIEYIFAYLCKLQILERWVNLNAEEGERVFRKLIAGLKNEIKKPDDDV